MDTNLILAVDTIAVDLDMARRSVREIFELSENPKIKGLADNADRLLDAAFEKLAPMGHNAKRMSENWQKQSPLS